MNLRHRYKQELNLYVTGEINSAKITSMALKSDLNSTGFGQKILVYYEYEISEGDFFR